ncbi:uncharacterized protein LOC124647187 [Lolium rigidum]|uniref:uncharacterized protein LOC124647187 n=1 Tax=Lolium rigidum TaxID=89674 RepID=UPI001F5DD215|nr:uncharacterized protein LOC124647187 [Lolium rigidum]
MGTKNQHPGDVYGKAAAETRLLSGALSGCSGRTNFKIPSPFIEYCNKHINVTLYVVILGLEHVCGPKEVAARKHCFCRKSKYFMPIFVVHELVRLWGEGDLGCHRPTLRRQNPGVQNGATLSLLLLRPVGI